MTWRRYHELTKHSVESLRRSPHVLDWANMPDPFRHYEGAPVLDLPADPPAPQTPALDVLAGIPGNTPARDGSMFLSQLLFNSAAISASRRVPSTGYRYALRVNPSSGNLHPTEFHFLTRGLKQWPDGLYHYRPSAHTAEQRALGDLDPKPKEANAPIVFVLTSIAWREAWKYGDRAYRYCLLDVGHAWQALALSARAMGCNSFATGCFPDDEIAQRCRLHEDEWPMLIVALSGSPVPLGEQNPRRTLWHSGQANQLSAEPIPSAWINAIHRATKVTDGVGQPDPSSARSRTHSTRFGPTAAALSRRAFGDVARARRSALDFLGGMQSMSLQQLSTILAIATMPYCADFASRDFVQLYLYAHRVSGLQMGVYRLGPGSTELELVRIGDQRVAAAGLSLGQDLAGNACVTFSMIGDLERASRAHGDRGYRYVHFEAGAIGQRLYLAAEALGLGATGIGAFYDEAIHQYLGLAPEQGQVVYHFAIGYPVPDARLDA